MAAERFTVVGGRGFIGSALLASLRAAGHDAAGVSHDAVPTGEPLGHVIYCSGIAASAAPDAVHAFAVHVEGVRRLLARGDAASLLYLSTTRVYDASPATNESAPITAQPAAGDIYRISKLAGETLCLGTPLPAVRVARLSNVPGNVRSTLFLTDIMRQAATTGVIRVRTTRDSAKDYVLLADTCRYLIAIALHGNERLYNVAYGANTENGVIFDALKAVTGATIEIAPEAQRAVTPLIDVTRLRAEFGPPRDNLAAELPKLYAAVAASIRA